MMYTMATSDATALFIRPVSLSDKGETANRGRASSNLNDEICIPCMSNAMIFRFCDRVKEVTHVLCRPYDVITENNE